MKVYDYRSITRPNRWCREEVAVEMDDGRLADTYWSLSSETHTLTDEERATAVFRFDTDQFDELDQYNRNSQFVWATYSPDDRETISSQHCLSKRWFIRKGVSPDLATKIQNARGELEEKQSSLRSAKSRVEWAQEELNSLLAELKNSEPKAIA